MRWLKDARKLTNAMLAGLLLVGGTFGGLSPHAEAAADNSGIVISQVYGGGGNSGATLKNDFIELYNPTNQAVSLEGWEVQYASASGPTWGSNVHSLTGSIAAGGYFLLQEAAGTGGTVNLPAPDASGGLALSGTNGKVRLLDGSDNVVDLVGFGSANEYETAPTAALSNTTAAIRKSLAQGDRGLDTNNNGSDFNVGAPDPRNSQYGNVVEAITANPAAGTVVSGTEVVLSTATAGAEIYYRTAAESTYALYSEPIAITQDTTIEAYATKSGFADSEARSHAYTVTAIASIADARILADGTSAIIEGIVTYKETTGGKNNLYVQDVTAGIVVRGANLSAAFGDRIQASGKLLQYFGLAELEVETAGVTVLEPGAGVPAPQAVTSASLSAENGEAYESEYVEIKNVTAGSSNAYNEFTVSDGDGSLTIKSALLQSGKTYEAVRGVVTYAFNKYMLVPRSEFDIIERAMSVAASPSPASFVATGTAVTLTTPASGGAIHYTTDGTDPSAASQLYSAPIIVHSDTVIKVIVVKDGVPSGLFTFAYTVQQTHEGKAIHDIQGAGHVSPYAGHFVTGVTGIVTVRREDGKWFLQAPKAEWDDSVATSEAILVQPAAAVGVAPGDLVTVGGTVQEVKEEGYADAHDLLTSQILATSIEVKQQSRPLPDPIVIGVDRTQPKTVIDNDGMAAFDPSEDALDFYESLEGMRLQIGDARIVGPYNFEIPVVQGVQAGEETPAGGVILTGEDLNPQRILIAKEPAVAVKTGDRFLAPIVGVLSYDYSNYKVIPEGALPDIESGSNVRETTALTPEADKLTVASFNIENFWNNTSGPETARKTGSRKRSSTA
ncbi:chitobiase/beta-hexosaminidase C-terminal domain-containing protein [Paenibacillus sp. LHD-117]|uniref:chitobiase/beta-hexosaminidase C-terminal domain-containing protein n=1 Tax=Paenibacillus sp. LHD-117 TaxID=3071412 RepID=UPI0027DEE9FA|nr:chitobiase/beta-hexosaminidase C-terminal domain-containing protein [Paenibacillus sp. LHD-117]MDQ6423143.1 chitobiase/beta-hexosaminidase C-terminal domain-containing protein [Paenibacillus sp. LHD-117]